MKQVSMDAAVRTETGKGAARRLRRAEQIPGILYGQGAEPVALSVNRHEFQRMLFVSAGERVMFTLNLTGGSSGGTRMALLKELQRHPVNDQIRHIDFYEVAMDQTVQVEVPVIPLGEAKGVKVSKGVMELIQREITIECLPLDIPNEIEVDISELDIGDVLHAGDITPGEGIRIMDDPGTTLITIGAAAVEAVEEEEEMEFEEGAEPEEAEETSEEE